MSSQKLLKNENLQNSPAARIRWLREKHFPGHGGKTQFARGLGIRLTSYVRYEQDVVPGSDIVVKMMDLTRVNPRWLINGSGPRYMPAYPDAGPRETTPLVVREDSGIWLPILARASAAGTERVGYTDHGDLGRDRLPNDLHEIEVKGDSMIPLALDGQFLLVTNAAPRSGDIAIVELQETDELLFKRIQIEPPNLICVSVNSEPRFPVITIPLRKVRRMRRVWGVKF